MICLSLREKLLMTKLGEHVSVINIFHGVNLTLYTVTSIHHSAGFFTINYQCVSQCHLNVIHGKHSQKGQQTPQT